MYSYNLGLKFGQIANAYPDERALVFPDGEAFSYSELDALSNQIAQLLSTRGVKARDVIGIAGNKHVYTFAAMLAALKIGAVYCMLDPGSPLERIYKILGTCAPKLVFAEQHIINGLQTFDIDSSIIFIPSEETAWQTALAGIPSAPIEASPKNTVEITATSPAYIMFTSGSTGNPKGAVITHGGVLNLIAWSKKTFGNGPGEVLTNVNPLYFDNSVFDFYSALFTGASLVPFSKAQVTNPAVLLDFIDQTGCTQWFSVPSMLIYLQTMRALTPARFTSIRRVIFGGEGYPKATLQKLYAQYKDRIDFHNVYGPTECTCICSTYLISDTDFEDLNGFPPLGSMIENFDYLIVDEQGVEVGPDEFGELCLLGPNVGLGYYNEKRLTERSFVQNPQHNRYPEVMYKTGDLVKYASADDKVHIRGRVDNQIKHMGYRIELEEVETALNQIDYVAQAAVVHGQFRGLSRMVAAVITTDKIDDKQLRADLGQIIPGYMIPNAFHTLDSLPKNANGKVDRKKITEMYFG